MLSIIGSEKHDSVYNETRYLKTKKSSIIYVISYNHAKIFTILSNFFNFLEIHTISRKNDNFS